MTTLNVQFSDASEEIIVSYFGSPQDPAVYQNLGTVDTSDPRWKTYFDAQADWVKPYLPAPTEA